MKLKYEPGTRYSNSEIYDEATSEVVNGWQVFVQKRPDGSLTGRRSFVNNAGILCGITLADTMRERAIRDSAPQLLEALRRALNAGIGADGQRPSPADEARAALAQAAGIPW